MKTVAKEREGKAQFFFNEILIYFYAIEKVPNMILTVTVV